MVKMNAMVKMNGMKMGFMLMRFIVTPFVCGDSQPAVPMQEQRIANALKAREIFKHFFVTCY